jgi:TRAP-type mannitol/chloroaromatic compound transport system permease small subunit
MNRWIGEGVSWVTLGLVLVVFIDVVMRYGFNTSFVFTQELEWHLFAFIFLIGAGYTLLTDDHVRVDIVYQRLSPKARAWVNLIGVIVFLLPGCTMLIVTSWKFTYNAWTILEGSPDPGGIPYRFIIKGTITVGFLLLALQGISMGVHSLFQLLGIEKPEEPV